MAAATPIVFRPGATSVRATDDENFTWLDPLSDNTSGVAHEYSSPELFIPIDEEHASARPNSVLLGTVADRRLRVRKAIPLDVSAEEGNVIVSWGATDEFACGASMGDAIEEFSKTIGELFFDLNDQSIPLGRDLARVRDILNEHIEQVIIR